MSQWEYLKLDLNEIPRRGVEIDVLNKAGGEGWELVTVTNNGIAILKREIGQPVKTGRRRMLETTAAG